MHGLEARPDLFAVRFDVPAVCARLLHEGEVDLGLIPAIEYLRDDYVVVPDVAIGSDGPVRSVAVFTTRPIERVRTLALDTSSRTSVALTRILCAKLWSIAPDLVPAAPDIEAMLARHDAALVIGDPALAIDAVRLGVEKLDLGEAWRVLTGLPFVYAMWTGRDGAVDTDQVAELQAARDRGVADVERIARVAGAENPAIADRALPYLRDTLKFSLGEREIAGVSRFHALAVELGLATAGRPVRCFS